MILAAFGKPTAPLDQDLLEAMRHYWNFFPDGAALPYCDTAGLWNCRLLMAKSLEKQYHEKVQINPKHLIFTVGGCGALQAAFSAIHQQHPNGKLVAVTPYYPQYQILNGGTAQNTLHPIDVTKTSFLLTAEALEESLKTISPSEISAFVFCDPNNPCGTTSGTNEWRKIADILRRYGNIPIVLDEAYAEMCFHEPHVSLLETAPDLVQRIVLMRSATKGFSAAGERMAIVVAPNKKIRSTMLDFITNISLHAPTSHQYAYTHAMQHLTNEKKQNLGRFYQKRVAFMQQELERINMQLDDPSYKPNATFYLLANLKKYQGHPLNKKAALILGKTESDPKIETDVDIAYHLLFTKNLAISPLSFFGVGPNECLMRITCSDHEEILREMSKRLEAGHVP